jgi:hypothetical protein
MASRTLAPRARSAAGSRSKTRVACRDSSTDGAAASVADARSGQLAVRVRTTLIVLLARPDAVVDADDHREGCLSGSRRVPSQRTS